MSILVTGGAGYIGSICADALLRQGHDVVIVDNLQEGHRVGVPAGAVFYEGDCGDKEILGEIFDNHDIEAVMHFAADTRVETSMMDPGQFFHNNLAKGIILLDVMKETGCDKIIFSSTAATFGEPKYIPVDEKHPQIPVNPYGESKLMFEKVLEWYHRAYGLKFNALRYFNAAGAGRELGDARRTVTLLIPVIMQVLLGQREKLFIFGNDYDTRDGTCIRDYIHVEDLAGAHILALEKLDDYPCGKYNLGNGRGFTNLEVIRAVEKVTGRTVPFVFAPRRPGDPAVLIASSELARKELEWEPEYGKLEDIVASAWEWHRKHPYGYAKGKGNI